MKRKTSRAKKVIPEGRQEKKTTGPENIQRRDAIKRIALMALGGITGASLISSCDPPWRYEDYDDYSDYYYDYYSRYSNNYYDYYSVYSAYWD